MCLLVPCKTYLTCLVGKYCASHILSPQLLGQDGYSCPVPQNLCAEPQREQSDVLRGMGDHRVDVHCIHFLHILHAVLLYASAHDLVQACTWREMSRCQRYPHFSGRVQHGIRYRHSAPANCISVAIEGTTGEEDLYHAHVRHRPIVCLHS
jgi:hypothetical protein